MSRARLARQFDAANRRALRYQQQQYAAWMKQMAHAQAAQALQMWQQRFWSLFTLHQQGVPSWNWHQVAASPPPVMPHNPHAHEQHAIHALHAYQPGFVEKLNGNIRARKAELEAAVHRARAHDHSLMVNHQAHYRQWQEQVAVAQQILAKDPAIYARALEITGASQSLESLGGKIHILESEPTGVNCIVMLASESIVPAEESTLTKTGKLSTRKFSKSKFWAFVLDQTASAALRVARDVLASLPIDRVIVNMCSFALNPATGHHETITRLGLHLPRTQAYGLNYQRLTPVEAIKSMAHRMSFKKTTGFERIEEVTLGEKWMDS